MTKQQKQLQKRFRFFLQNCGYSIPPGKAACALRLAKAEQWLDDQEGLETVVFNDDSPDLSWWDSREWCSRCETTRRFFWHSRQHFIACASCGLPLQREIVVVCVAIVDSDTGHYLASLSDITEPTADYLRVVKAELALEIME